MAVYRKAHLRVLVVKNKLLQTSLQSDKAKEYCLECLKKGNTLAQELAKVLIFEQGSFFAITSEDANIPKINDFWSGDLLPPLPLEVLNFRGVEYPARQKRNSAWELANYLERFLRENKSLWYVFEDVVQNRSDPKIQTMGARIGFFNEEVYYYAKSNQLSLEETVRLIHHVDGQWYYMSLVTSYPVQTDDIEVLDLETLKRIAEKTVHLAIGAYDMEGYVCWEKVNT